LHCPLDVYKQLSLSPEGFCAILDGGGEQFRVWLRPASDCPRFGKSAKHLRSSAIPAGEYLVSTVEKVKQVVRVILTTSNLQEYEVVAHHAEEIIDRLFLAQVRIVELGRTVRLFVGGKRVTLNVMKMEPELEFGLVGTDSELEILPPTTNSIPKPIRKESKIRIRECTGPTLINQNDAEALGLEIVKEMAFFRIGKSTLSAIVSALAPEGWIQMEKSEMNRLDIEQHQWVQVQPTLPIENSIDPIMPVEISATFKSWRFYEQLERLLIKLFTVQPTKGILIQGEALVGKTLLAQALVQNGTFPSHYTNLKPIEEERSFQRKRVIFDELFSVGLKKAPCVFFIDHAESILAASSDESFDDEEAFLWEQLLFSFLERVDYLHRHMKSPVILIVESERDLCEAIGMSFQWIKTITVERPADDLRRIILQRVMCGKDLDTMVEETAGLLPSQVAHHSAKDKIPIEIARPTCPIKWDELVGMDKAKQTLEEALLWPIIYEELHNSNGYKVPGGVLLYGPSGSGKTLLARSFVNRLPLSVSVFSVAGPSLLGKYVGSSERAVRDLFTRARARKPSLILLEEAEALCPRRGTDNTGTTDRVVNQLLTELDGAEGRTGIFLLAISSRPDLIDPALLRPGRIGQRLGLHLPDERERGELLFALAPTEIANDPILLEQLARDTEGLGAAHLRAILLDAQIDANRNLEERRGFISPEMVLSSLVRCKAALPKVLNVAKSDKPRLTFA
jgi:SpoVK/Ycf46/Vps4 family AAA+-type ATPase